MKILAHKTAFVTGSSQGLGEGIAIELAIAGANIVVTHLDTPSDCDNASTVVEILKTLGRDAIALPLDVTNAVSIRNCIKEAFNHFPKIDILVNNAGVMQHRLGSDATLEDFDLCYDVNVKGVWAVSRGFIPHFKSNKYGKIINISSVAGRRGANLPQAYCASKAAVINLTQSLAEELGPSNINVNAICPGIIWTAAWKQYEGLADKTADDEVINSQPTFKSIEKTVPLRRHQTAEDIGYATVFLASSQAKNITGQSLNVDGGLMMC